MSDTERDASPVPNAAAEDSSAAAAPMSPSSSSPAAKASEPSAASHIGVLSSNAGESEEPTGDSYAGSEPRDDDDSETLKLFIGQLPYSCDEKKLHSVFSEFGEIHDLVILKDRNTGASKGTADFNRITNHFWKGKKTSYCHTWAHFCLFLCHFSLTFCTFSALMT